MAPGAINFVLANVEDTWRTLDEVRRACRLDPQRVASALGLLWARGQVECELVNGEDLYRVPAVAAEAQSRRCRECDSAIPSTMRSDSVFCSRRCNSRMQTRRARARHHKTQPVRACEYCSTLFQPLTPRRRFCGSTCANAAKNRRPGIHHLICAHCRIEFQSRKTGQLYCSRACLAAVNRERNSDFGSVSRWTGARP